MPYGLYGEKTVENPSIKKGLTQSKAVLANLMGDESILQALHANKGSSNTDYEKLNQHAVKRPDSEEPLSLSFGDE